MNTDRPAYRPDIDGLRAVAIAPVVAFHAFPNLVPGGFVGVDVFFVISGYLISLLIFDRLDRGVFTFKDFYARRIRRIFPALILVLVACQLAGWFWLYSREYQLLGKHVAAGAGFVANLVLWSEASYFDVASETKPLLHLWSIGIEEQFYLLWPFVLYLAWQRQSFLPFVLIVMLGASFVINVLQVRTDEVATFYSPVTRLWELLLGATLAYLTLPAGSRHGLGRFAGVDDWSHRLTARARDALAATGLAAIAVAVVMFDADTSFPGWRAALPAGGALLLIAAGPSAWINRHVLATRGLIWLGLISYPLYLWHWPLLALTTASSGPAEWTTRALLVVVSLALATLTYLLLERPIRFGRSGARTITTLCALMALAGGAGYATFAMEGFQERAINRSDRAHFLAYYERLRTGGLRAAYRAECDFMEWETERTRPQIDPSCTTPGERRTVLLWGDSYAQALSPGLRAILPDGVGLAQVATSGCAPRHESESPAGRCETANRFALQAVSRLQPDLVILAQIALHDATDWISLAQDIRARGAGRVLLIGPVPQWTPSLPVIVTSHYWDSALERINDGLDSEVFKTDALLKERLAGSGVVEYVSLIDSLCNDDGCRAAIPGSDRRLFAIDQGHLSPEGSLFVAQTILRPHIAKPVGES